MKPTFFSIAVFVWASKKVLVIEPRCNIFSAFQISNAYIIAHIGYNIPCLCGRDAELSKSAAPCAFPISGYCWK